MIVRVTGSQTDRVVRCPASAALPQIHDGDESEARDRGSAMHSFLERVTKVGREAALAEVDEQWRPFCEGINLAKLGDLLQLTPELALAYDWKRDAARILQPVAPRVYEIDETREVAMTLDLAGVNPDTGAVYVGDYKSGYSWLPEPKQSMQLLLGALALSRVHEAHTATIEYIRVRDDGEPLRFDAEIDVFMLDGIGERVRHTMERVTEMRAELERTGLAPDVTEGPWCRFCPARQHCPAKTALVRKVLHDQPIPYVLPITPENAGHVYQLWRKAKNALAIVEKAIHAYAKTDPLPVGQDDDGSLRFFGSFQRLGNEELDGAIAYQVLAEYYGPEQAAKVVEMSVTKKAITDVVNRNLDKLEPGERKSHRFDAIVKAIGERGGSKRNPIDKPTEYVVSATGEAKTSRKKKAS